MQRINARPLSALLALALVVGAAASAGGSAGTRTAAAPGSATAATPKPGGTPVRSGGSSTAKPAPKPAGLDSLGPGAAELAGFAFLAGRWQGELRTGPIQMDIAIDGSSITPGRPMRFDIHAEPRPGTMSLGVEGDYRSFVTWSESARALRAVVTDRAGRGVELTGGKSPGSNEWLFNSTDDGAPFPFRIRVTPVSATEVLVAYSTGGRLPMRHEITFHRVAG
jgi:hypothetical protein